MANHAQIMSWKGTSGSFHKNVSVKTLKRPCSCQQHWVFFYLMSVCLSSCHFKAQIPLIGQFTHAWPSAANDNKGAALAARHKLCQCVTLWLSELKGDYWRGVSGAVFSAGEGSFCCYNANIIYNNVPWSCFVSIVLANTLQRQQRNDSHT